MILPELLALKGRGSMPMLEWGYLVLIATRVLALLASFLLVLLPLWLRRRKESGSRGLRWRLLVYFAAIGMAFLMGIPFPLGMSYVSEKLPSWIPWAWGINGCASVVSAILATLVAIQIGFVFVVMAAVVLYLLAALVLRQGSGLV